MPIFECRHGMVCGRPFKIVKQNEQAIKKPSCSVAILQLGFYQNVFYFSSISFRIFVYFSVTME